MKFRQGDMWSQLGDADLILVTANAYVKTDGNLVMGRGAALELTQKFPSYQPHFGSAIEHIHARMGFYGVIILPVAVYTQTHLGIFQVKYHWRDEADPELIRMSVMELERLTKIFVGWHITMNYPGIGNGRLSKDRVAPLLQSLPDSVEVWEK